MAAPVAKAGAETAERFWSGLSAALGKPAFEITTTRQGRREVSRTVKVPGVTKSKVGKRTVVSVAIPRYVAVAGVVVLGSAAYVKLGGKVPSLNLPSLPKLPTVPSLPTLSGAGGVLPGPSGWGVIKW